MANHKSAIKRARQNVIKRARNTAVKTTVKNAVKNVRTAAADNAAEPAAQSLKTAASLLDKAAKKGVIHKRTASRKISRLTKLVNTIS